MVRLVAPLALLLALASCRAVPLGLVSNRPLLREVQHRDLFHKPDTVHTTITVPGQVDTFRLAVPIPGDTVRLAGPERVRVQVVRLKGDTVRLAVECPPDTIELAVPCPPAPMCPDPAEIGWRTRWRLRLEGVILSLAGIIVWGVWVFVRNFRWNR